MNNIDGVIVTPLRQVPDNRGTVKEFMPTVSPISVYTTSIYAGVVKGWHGYFTKTLNYCVPFGMVKLVLYDTRETSETFQQINEFYLGDYNYSRVTIPPGVLNAFQGIHPTSVIVVASDESFDESKMWRVPFDNDTISYDWSKINK